VYRVLCEHFVTRYVFTVRSCLHLAQPPSWMNASYRRSATAYSVYSQLASILEAVPHLQPENAPCRGDRDPLIAAGTCECGNEPSGSIKSGEFLD
jgi:hypothetical protein